jgi:hypothetical protein
MLEPDRDQIEIFAEGLFRHVGQNGYVSLRSFYQAENKPFRIIPIPLAGGLKTLFASAGNEADKCAKHEVPVVFCPPIAVFSNRNNAGERDLLLGPVLSVECDEDPQDARRKLETILGPATIVVRSGGRWTNGAGETEDKLHLHWRLKEPAAGDDLAKLKRARCIASDIVGADDSAKPVVQRPLTATDSCH